MTHLTAIAGETISETAGENAPWRIAIAGNPNCGKTSIFNALTGANQTVGNYPGVTVEERRGRCVLGDRTAEVIDLPGTYGLCAYSPEERVAEAELRKPHDVVIVVADSSGLSRNLVLLAQLMQTSARIVLCLNMADEARAAGQIIDLPRMERLLGFPVVETVAHRRGGIDLLKETISRAIGSFGAPRPVRLGPELEEALDRIREKLPEPLTFALDRDWIAVRLLAGDEARASEVAALPGGFVAVETARAERERLERDCGRDVDTLLAEGYFAFVHGLLCEVVTQRLRADARQVTDALDRVVAHRFFGLPFFAAAMFALFWMTFELGEIPMGWIESGFAALGEAIASRWPSGPDSPLLSLLVDGVLGGVGGVVVFLPNILLLFLGLALLEDTGYMARAAFLTDRAMNRFGLHGKSFIPLLTGFGCSVPGIMATRTLEDERDRLATMLVLPLMSCGARLPIWMLLIPAFFPPHLRAVALFSIYAIGIALALLLALLLRKTLLRGEPSPFVMELPPYRLPTLRGISLKTVQKSSAYLKKAGTTILGISVLLWAATSYPAPKTYEVDSARAQGRLTDKTDEQLDAMRAKERLEKSFAGQVGTAVAPLFEPLGFDWKIVTAMIGAFAAKEVFVSQMGIVYAIGDGDGAGAAGLAASLSRDYPPRVGFAMMLFLLIATPCMATFAVTRKESGRWRYALAQFGGLTVLGYALAFVAYRVAGLFA